LLQSKQVQVLDKWKTTGSMLPCVLLCTDCASSGISSGSSMSRRRSKEQFEPKACDPKLGQKQQDEQEQEANTT
jgi:hypothetical protein